jgi:hypothetical protein
LPSNGKRPAVRAGEDRWRRLGELLALRRADLGYRYRPAFAAERLPRTPQGNVNVRLVTDVEGGVRDTIQAPTLKHLARAYDVTYESVLAVLKGESDELAPATFTSVPLRDAARVTDTLTAARHDGDGEDGGWLPAPLGDDALAAAARPYDAAIWERIAEYRARHPRVAAEDIPGPDLFPGSPEDARTWDDPRLRRNWPVRQRVWMIAGLQAFEARRRERPGNRDIGLTGALIRGKVAGRPACAIRHATGG